MATWAQGKSCLPRPPPTLPWASSQAYHPTPPHILGDRPWSSPRASAAACLSCPQHLPLTWLHLWEVDRAGPLLTPARWGATQAHLACIQWPREIFFPALCPAPHWRGQWPVSREVPVWTSPGSSPEGQGLSPTCLVSWSTWVRPWRSHN